MNPHRPPPGRERRALDDARRVKSGSSGPLDRLVQQLLDEARDRKRREAARLRDLRGGWHSAPVRGSLLPNGRPSAAWLFWRRAVENHRRATRELAALLKAIQCQ